MKRSASPLVLLLLATSLTVGCAQPPTETVEAARARVAETAAEGATYAADALGSAQAVVEEMDAELAAQADRFAMTRDYERATQLANEAMAAADAVEAAVEAEKQRLRDDATQTIGQAEDAIAEARAGLDELELTEEDAAALAEDLAAAEATVAAASNALASEDFQGAVRQADAAVQAVGDVAMAVDERVAAMEAEEAEAEVDIARAARGGIDIPRDVYVDGEMLAAGAYTVRLGEGATPPVPGEGGPDSSRWVEFVSDADGSVAGRGLAAAIPDAEMSEVREGGWFPRNQAYVDELQGGEYVRIWLNRDGVTYLVHAPTSAP